MEHANELLGFLHGAYGLGATISPLIATAMVTKGNLPWYNFYFVMVCIVFFIRLPSSKLPSQFVVLFRKLICTRSDWLL
jgi:fucose permease